MKIICRKCGLEMLESKKVIILTPTDRSLGLLHHCPWCRAEVILNDDTALVHENYHDLDIVVLSL